MAKCLSNHSKGRLKERYKHISLTQKQIRELVRNRNLTFVKKLTLSRTLAYIEREDESIKLIVRPRDNHVITFLPIHNIFCYGPKELEFEGDIYKIKIYPDCYLETKNPRVMTQFFILDQTDLDWKECKKNKHPFQQIFDMIWREFNESKIKEEGKI